LLTGSPAIDQAQTAYCTATDQAGTARPQGSACDVGAFEALPDTTPPNTTIAGTPPNPSGSSVATFSFVGSDAGSGVASLECRLDAGGFSTCTSPHTYTGLSDGPHTFQVRAVDAATNVDPTPASFTWQVDTTGPDTTITSGPADPTNSASGSITFTGSDSGTGVASFQCAVDLDGYATCTSPWSMGALPDGPHQVTVRAVDDVGNYDPTPAIYTWTIDTSAPTVSITSAPPSSTTARSAAFSFTGAGGVDHFECSLDSAAFAVCTSPVTVSGLTVGNHTFRVRAVNALGSTSSPAVAAWSVTGGSGLAVTGAAPQVPAGLAVMLLFAGVVLTVLPRLRRRPLSE
jgi:hypothetical protein